MDRRSLSSIASWFVGKWRQRLEDSDHSYATVATQMRKQGIPLAIALLVLVGRGLR
jgi:hypothetical protein